MKFIKEWCFWNEDC